MNKVTYILIAIIIILAVIVGVMSVRKPLVYDTHEIEYQNQIDSLNMLINGYRKERYRLDSVIISYKTDISILTHQMDSIENYINWLKQDYNDQINDILGYNANELNKFFTDRYPR